MKKLQTRLMLNVERLTDQSALELCVCVSVCVSETESERERMCMMLHRHCRPAACPAELSISTHH